MLLRMFSTDVALRLPQRSQVISKQLLAGVPVQLSKTLAGKVTRLPLLLQALWNVVALFIVRAGKDVKPEQPSHVWVKLVPLEVSIAGKLVRLEQLCQAD